MDDQNPPLDTSMTILCLRTCPENSSLSHKSHDTSTELVGSCVFDNPARHLTYTIDAAMKPIQRFSEDSAQDQRARPYHRRSSSRRFFRSGPILLTINIKQVQFDRSNSIAGEYIQPCLSEQGQPHRYQPLSVL